MMRHRRGRGVRKWKHGGVKMAEAVRQEIEQRVREFEAAFNRGDLAALTALYTEDATLLPPDSGAITGRHGIEHFWRTVRDSGVVRVALRTQQVEASGDLAAEVGTAELAVASGDGQTSTVRVKYVVAWRRRAGGPWQLGVDIWNNRAAE